MDIDFKSFKRFTPETAEAWGRKNYVNWLPELQNQAYEPRTPAEEFFRYYTQGVHNFFNNITRFDDINSYDFSIGYSSHLTSKPHLSRLALVRFF